MLDMETEEVIDTWKDCEIIYVTTERSWEM